MLLDLLHWFMSGWGGLPGGRVLLVGAESRLVVAAEARVLVVAGEAALRVPFEPLMVVPAEQQTLKVAIEPVSS